MTYKSAITKLNLKPWKLLVLAVVFIVIETIVATYHFNSVIALIIWVILLLDAIVSKIRDLIHKK